MPVYPPRYTVVVLDTGEEHGPLDSWEEVAMCLAFARLSREEVEIVTDAPLMATITAWGVSAGRLYPHPAATSISSRQWSLAPHSSTPLSARTLTPSWKPREAKA